MKAPESVYTDRIGAEVEAKAEEWRCRDQEITQLEHEIDQAWVEIAPSEARQRERAALGPSRKALDDQPERTDRVTPRSPSNQVVDPEADLLVHAVSDRSVQCFCRNADPTWSVSKKSVWATLRTLSAYRLKTPISMALTFLMIPQNPPYKSR